MSTIDTTNTKFDDPSEMPKNRQLTVHQIDHDANFCDHMPGRFTKRGSPSPAGYGSDGKEILWQYWITDPKTKESFFVTECDIMSDEKRIRYIVFKYYV